MTAAKDDPTLDTLVSGLAKDARLLGIDLGEKTIGLALSDVGRSIATPLETIRRSKFTPDAERIRAIAARFEVGAVIIGLPLNMDGSEGPRAQSDRKSTRLNSSHANISYAVFCLKK